MAVTTTVRTLRLEESRDAVIRLLDLNISGKLDSYFKRFSKQAQPIEILLSVSKNKKSLYNGKLQFAAGNIQFIYSREDYQKLDDLVNHLVDHLKQDLAKT
jgi:hypothetical protein